MTDKGRVPAVTVVGSLNLDIVVAVDRLPVRGETVVGSTVRLLPGGKGANQAAAAAALGAEVAMVGRVGRDDAGAGVLADLRERGVDIAAVSADDAPTGTATVAVEAAGGENLIVVAPGANAALSAADVQVDAVAAARVLLVQLEIPPAAVSAAVAHASGIVVLNPAPPRELPSELLAAVDVLVPNEHELLKLAGAVSTDGSPESLAALVRQVTARDAVVTLGARGALVVPADGPAVLVAAPQVDAIDTTGAGDCFCGAFAVALAAGRSLAEATRLACAAAAQSTTGDGARGALPREFVR